MGMENLDFLLHASDPWVVYRTMVDLAGREERDPEALDVRRRMLAHPLLRGLAEEMRVWPGTVLNSHRSSGQLYHKLVFLADLGITHEDFDLSPVRRVMTENRSPEGVPRLPMNIPVHFGGTGRDTWAWSLCDAPLQLYAAAKTGLLPEDELMPGVLHLVGLVRENGWPCAGSSELGNFRGPGRKGDPCPYVNLIMLQLLSLFPPLMDGPEARAGLECLLDLWDRSREEHPFMFYMGTDFRKLKAPLVWYDLLHLLDVLSRYDAVIPDPRFRSMLDTMNAKADSDGLFTPESVWTAWKGWEFAQKKAPSAWVTLLAYRINRRAGKAG